MLTEPLSTKCEPKTQGFVGQRLVPGHLQPHIAFVPLSRMCAWHGIRP